VSAPKSTFSGRMTVMHTILVPLDGSRLAEQALSEPRAPDLKRATWKGGQ
jgi:hypothetical protein